MADLLIAYDASTPLPAGVAGTNAVLIYAGGDTPHVWTAAEIAEQPEQYRLPGFVQSNPAQAVVQTDAAAFIAWLQSLAVPTGSCTFLDLETAVDQEYVSGFGALVNSAGYKVLPYGSKSTLFQNPQLDGYFVADPGATALYPNTVGTQYAYDGTYDLSFLSPALVLWQRPPTPAPPPPTPTPPPAPPLPTPAPAFPLPAGNWFGPPNPSPDNHSGMYPNEGADRARFSVWEARMKWRGWAIAVDGRFTPPVESVVLAFQKEFGLAQDGKVGPITWGAAWTETVQK